jgi:putative endonuclease
MQRGHAYFVYILASQPHGTLYIGVTNDVRRRVHEHRDGGGGSFTKRYGVMRHVWFEQHSEIIAAIQREKSLKRWPRDWKQNLI